MGGGTRNATTVDTRCRDVAENTGRCEWAQHDQKETPELARAPPKGQVSFEPPPQDAVEAPRRRAAARRPPRAQSAAAAEWGWPPRPSLSRTRRGVAPRAARTQHPDGGVGAPARRRRAPSDRRLPRRTPATGLGCVGGETTMLGQCPASGARPGPPRRAAWARRRRRPGTEPARKATSRGAACATFDHKRARVCSEPDSGPRNGCSEGGEAAGPPVTSSACPPPGGRLAQASRAAGSHTLRRTKRLGVGLAGLGGLRGLCPPSDPVRRSSAHWELVGPARPREWMATAARSAGGRCKSLGSSRTHERRDVRLPAVSAAVEAEITQFVVQKALRVGNGGGPGPANGPPGPDNWVCDPLSREIEERTGSDLYAS